MPDQEEPKLSPAYEASDVQMKLVSANPDVQGGLTPAEARNWLARTVPPVRLPARTIDTNEEVASA